MTGIFQYCRKLLFAIINMKLMKKLLLSFFLLAVLSAGIIGVTSYVVLKRAISNEISENIQNTLKQVMQNIDYKLNDIENLYFNVITSKSLKDILENPSPSEQDKRNFLKDFIENIYPNTFGGKSRYLHSVYFYGTNGVNLASDGNYLALKRTQKEIESNFVFQQAQTAGGKLIWVPTHVNIFVNEEYGEKLLSCASKVISSDLHKDWGLMVINVKEQFLYDSYKNVLEGFEGDIFITDEEGMVVSHQDKTMLTMLIEPAIINRIKEGQSDRFTASLDGEEHFVYYFTSSYTGWKIIEVIPVDATYKNIILIKRTIIIVLIITIFLSIFISFLISFGISRPVKELLNRMKDVQDGNMDTKVNLHLMDEIGELGTNFNKMTLRIKELINNNQKYQEKMRKLELRALQAQITPHFLYNTLDTIYWMNKTGNADKSADLILALARFYRLGLNKGREITSIEKEIDHVSNYLQIQSEQFLGKFVYEINVEAQIYSYQCIKFLLQPLVENSLVHGLRPCKKPGFINIIGKLEGEDIILEVIDNGLGFDIDDCEKLFKEPENDSSGYGLYNVKERIKLHYGEEYGFQIYSRYGNGTKVEIRIPACK